MRVDKYSKELGRAESKNAAECSADVPAGLRSDLSEAAAVGNGNVLHTDSERYQLSNTVPSTLHPDIKVGIDYLTFWVYGGWAEDVAGLFERLDQGKKDAATEKHGTEFEVGGLQFLLLSNGSGRGSFHCRWCLQHRGLFFGVCNNANASSSRPLVKVEIKGEPLTLLGVQGALELVDDVLRALGVKYSRSLLSRIDIKADHLGTPVSRYADDFDDDRVITRARQLNWFGTFQERQTIIVGNRKANRVVCRFYDKLAELKGKPDKEVVFLKHITGGELVDSCTRVEFEIRREGLKEFRVDSFEDCFGRMGHILRYLTTEFLRFSDSPVDRNHTDRAKTAPHWLATQEAFEHFANTFRQLPARTPESIPFDATRHQQNMTGHLISWIIKDGAAPSCPHDIMEFAQKRFLAGLLSGEVFEKYQKAALSFQHKHGLEAEQFFTNRTIEAKQALTGVEKIADEDIASSTITKPSDLFEKDDNEWTQQKRAA